MCSEGNAAESHWGEFPNRLSIGPKKPRLSRERKRRKNKKRLQSFLPPLHPSSSALLNILSLMTRGSGSSKKGKKKGAMSASVPIGAQSGIEI